MSGPNVPCTTSRGYKVHLKEHCRDERDPHPDRLFFVGYEGGFWLFTDSRQSDGNAYLFPTDSLAYFEENPD